MKHLVAGNLTGRTAPDVLLYSSDTGEATLYASNGSKKLKLLRRHSCWRRTWSNIICGDFAGREGNDAVLLYDRSSGAGEFYRVDDAGEIHLICAPHTWRKSWSQIAFGRFAKDARPGLLFYDAAAGDIEFYSMDGHGGITFMSSHGSCHTGWSHIIPGEFTDNETSDILFYDSTFGYGEFYSTDGGGNIQLRKEHRWLKGWTHIVPVSIGERKQNGLFFYQAASGHAELYRTDDGGDIHLIQEFADFRRNVSHIVAGGFLANKGACLMLFEESDGKFSFFPYQGAKRAESHSESRFRESFRSGVDREMLYRMILELGDSFTLDELKRARRRTVAQYHPDKVAHLAKEFQELADLRTKEINEAYDYFCNQFATKRA